MDLQQLMDDTPKKDVILIIGDWNAKVGEGEVRGIVGNFGLGKRNEAGERLIEFCQENLWSSQTRVSNNPNEDYTHGQHRTDNIEIKLR